MMIPLASVTVLATGLLFQDPEPPKKKAEGKAVQEASADKDKSSLRTWNDKEAKDKLAAFKNSYKRKASLKQKLAALETLSSGRHKSLVKPLYRIVKTERKVEPRKVAARLLGNQTKAHARKTILLLLNDSKINRKAPVAEQLILALAKESYQSRDWRDLAKLFRRDLDNKNFPGVQKSIIELAGKHKELGAINLLLEHMDEPQPAWVDDPTNPPADYWERRWNNWEVWRLAVRETLYQITGQRFTKSKEARTWIRKNRRKLQKKKKSKKKKG